MSSEKKVTTTVTKVEPDGTRTVTTTVTNSSGSTSSCFSEKTSAKPASAATPKPKAQDAKVSTTTKTSAKSASAATPKAKTQDTASSTTGKTSAKPASKPASAATPKPKAQETSESTVTKTPAKPVPAATPKPKPKPKPLTFEEVVLAEHNRLRAKHSSPPLKLNPAISRYAQEWANNLAARNQMYHRSNGKYGENIFASFGPSVGQNTIDGKDPVKAFYNEIKDYRFGEPTPTRGAVGHFTQVVWKASRELGVGIAKNSKAIYVVCNYDPPGNYTGKYALNVTRN